MSKMSLNSQIGEHTLSRLEKAAKDRFREADWLRKGDHRLTAIYLYGYVVEIVLGSAYFRMKGFGATTPIKTSELRKAIDRAKSKSMMEDRSHPIDGRIELIISEKEGLYGPPYEKRLIRRARSLGLDVRENWGPRLRYRTIDPNEEQVVTVRDSAEWFLVNSLKF